MSYGYGFNTINSNFYYEMGDLKEKLKKYCSRNIDGSYDHEQIISVRSTID